MPSRPSRSRSRSYSRSRSRSPSDRKSRPKELPYDAPEISESDYFQKNDEFRVWLRSEKGKVTRVYPSGGVLISRQYFDELSGDKARRYANIPRKITLLNTSLWQLFPQVRQGLEQRKAIKSVITPPSFRVSRLTEHF
jgi:hypothetical protein